MIWGLALKCIMSQVVSQQEVVNTSHFDQVRWHDHPSMIPSFDLSLRKNTRWIYFPSLRDKALRRRSRLGFPTLKMYSHPGYDCFWGVDQTYVIQQPLLLMVQIFGQPPEISKDPLRNHGNKLLTSTGLKTPDFWSINSMSVEFAESINI